MAVKANKIALLAVLLVLVLAPPAFAALAKHGPIVPYNATAHTGNGYPRWYMDNNGVAVDIQVPPFANIVPNPKPPPPATILGAPMMIFGPIPPGTTDQFTLDIGFDAEVFYFLAQPDRATFDDLFPGGATKVLNVLVALEAGFSTLVTINGNQAVWQRIRFNWRKSAPEGFYKFIHPYGVEEGPLMVTTGVDPTTKLGDLLYTIDTPIINIPPFNFDLALGNTALNPGKIGPFLFQLNPPPVITPPAPGFPIPPGFNKPTDWLGDGATAATFTGSPLGPTRNMWRIEAYTDAARTIPLNIFPTTVGGLPTVNFVETNLGVIAGHRYHFPDITPARYLLLSD